MPAHNTARVLEKTVRAIPPGIADEIIVIDDGSRDKTREVAEKIGLKVISHDRNRGYGAAQKTGYRRALEDGADVVVMLHSDFQYDPTLVPEMVMPIARGDADACFGSRMVERNRARAGGMPLWKFIPNIFLSAIEEWVLGLGLSEYHTGYRAFARKTLERIPFEKNSDNFVFDTQVIVQLKLGGFRVREIAIPTRYTSDSSSMGFMKSVRYGVGTLKVLFQYLFYRARIRSYPQFAVKNF